MLYETVYRGDMYYVERNDLSSGSEQKSGRPAIIVSNDVGNRKSPVVEVVYLTTQPKNDLPTHVDILSASKPSTALCEQITTINKDRLAGYIGAVTPEELEDINRALLISLQLEFNSQADNAPAAEQLPSKSDDYMRLEVERDTYKNMYENLLSRLIKQ